MSQPSWPSLIARIQNLDPAAQHLWGKMNLGQMLVHCRMPLEVGLGKRVVARKDNFFKNKILVHVIMAIPWPKGKAQSHPEFRVVDKNLPVKSVAEEQKALLEIVASFAAGGFTPSPHPIFGVMDFQAWSRFQRKHLDHHLNQFGA